MDATTLKVLQELERQQQTHNEPETQSLGRESRISEIAKAADLSEEEVEDALEFLVDQRAVLRHSLGGFEITELGIAKTRGGNR
ncbi:MAG TPA: hypothetical protein VHO25_16350 [Polyangiaceae bacterium]|nr:hypothetical protein [Polyangiaceae bacterium]